MKQYGIDPTLRGFYGAKEIWEMEHGYGYRIAPQEGYRGITSISMLYDMLSELWCADTCAPRMRQDWCQDNKTLGQCSITAFLVQDIFGGEVYGILRPGGNYHCYNVFGSYIVDLTSEQFGAEAASLCYEGNPLQRREDHFAKEEKYERYLLLKGKLERLVK